MSPAIFANATFDGYYSSQKIRHPLVEHPAFGYMHLDKYEDKNGLADFEVINNRPFQPAQSYLPSSQLTYDNFSFSGAGLGGSFRLHRSDCGVVSEPKVWSQSIGVDYGMEAGVGTGIEFGINLGMHYSASSSKRWKLGNSLLDGWFKFQGASANDPLFEASYFKLNGETARESENLHLQYNDALTSYLPLKNFGHFTKVDSKWSSVDGERSISSNIQASERNFRKTSIRYLRADEAKHVGLEKRIKRYQFDVVRNANNNLPYAYLNRSGDHRKGHHISSFEIISDQGSKYIYGIPVYNTEYIEASFNVHGKHVNSKKLVTYSDVDASIENRNGKDHFYSSTTIPPYATNHLLTAILSNNYVDFSGNGPSPDDAGSYVKYNYSLVHENFGWRAPAESSGSNYASHQPRLRTTEKDDIGNYIYGEKEIWYPHSVETKNYIAVFKLTHRKDGFGFADESGAKDYNKSLMKLTSITLYTRHNFKKYGENAIPLKVIKFEYDYSLCSNTYNNIGTPEIVNGKNINAKTGKLTLKRILIRHGNSHRGLLNPYEFEYNAYNPKYNRLAIDRWGYYKPVSHTPDNIDYPYVDQNKVLQDLYASAWNLTHIKLPSGGSIEVKYESDDYTYVQNKRAGRMFKIMGLGFSPDYNTSAKLKSKPSKPFHVYIELDEQLNSDEEFKRYYVADMEYLYFKAFVDITSSGDHEYVSGYGKIIESGICPNNPNYGWVSLEYFKSSDWQNANIQNINPITWFALQLAKDQMQDKIFPMSSINFTGGKADIARGLLGVVVDFVSLMRGIDATLLNIGFCKWLSKKSSWVRLSDPSLGKLGGGHRVKSIILRDNWQHLSKTGSDAFYQTNYTYTSARTAGGTFSSGVATYEPLVGGDENSLHQPLFYQIRESMFYVSLTYIETPLVEFAYPAATIGYAEVTVADLKRAGVTQHATGKTVHKFYTARIHPLKISQTKMDRKIFKPDHADKLSLLIAADISRISVSQGYRVLSNDMHGKPASSFNYSEIDNVSPVTGVKFEYYPPGAKLKTVNDLGLIGESRLGRDIDVTIYSKKEHSEGGKLVLEAQIEANATPPPTIALTGYSKVGVRSHQFSLVSTNKMVMDYVQTKSVTSFDMGGQIRSEHLAFDEKTGNPITTRTFNEFGDWVYNSSTPAYWKFESMGPASENVGSRGILTMTNGGFANTPGSGFVLGDKLLLRPKQSSPNMLEPVVWITTRSNTTITALTKDGLPIPDGIYLYIIVQSGNVNNLSAAASSSISLSNPLASTFYQVSNRLINATVSTFHDHTNNGCKGLLYSLCDQGNCITHITCNIQSPPNPYAWGVKGIWKPHKNYVYNALRSYKDPNMRNSSDARFDGIYQNFTPYWLNHSGTWTVGSDPNWIQSNEVTLTTNNQHEVENKNALNNYATALLGYNQTKVVAAAQNCRYTEAFSDNMEEYNYLNISLDCNPIVRRYLFNYEIADCIDGNGLAPAPDDDVLLGDLPIVDTAVIAPPGSADLCRTKHLVDDAHTGLTSYKIFCNNGPVFKFPVVSPDSCRDHFSLLPKKKYILSMWVKQPGADRSTYKYDAEVLIECGNNCSTIASTSGNIIEGWQKIEASFEIPANGTLMRLDFTSATADSLYIDDIRIHPFNSTMITSVYNPYTLLLMAELDDNNFATFYEYDQEFQLNRINKETEKGILTSKEFFSNLHKEPSFQIPGIPEDL